MHYFEIGNKKRLLSLEYFVYCVSMTDLGDIHDIDNRSIKFSCEKEWWDSVI